MSGWFSVQLSISGPTNGIFILVPKLEGNDETEKKKRDYIRRVYDYCIGWFSRLIK